MMPSLNTKVEYLTGNLHLRTQNSKIVMFETQTVKCYNFTIFRKSGNVTLKQILGY